MVYIATTLRIADMPSSFIKAALAALAIFHAAETRAQTPTPQYEPTIDGKSGLLFTDLSMHCVVSAVLSPAPAGYQCAVGKVELTHFADYVAADAYVAMQEQEWSEKPGFVERHFALFVSERPNRPFEQVIAWIPGTSEHYKLWSTQSGVLGTFAIVEGVSGAAGRGIIHYVVGRQGTGWHAFDATEWQTKLIERLPKGYYPATPALLLDYGKGLALFNIYKPSDALCCANGGSMIVQLALRGTAFVVSDTRLSAVTVK